MSTLVCNYFLFYKDTPGFDKHSIDTTLELLKSLYCHHMLPELLLCKTYLLMQENNIALAFEVYKTAHQFGLYFYESQYELSIEKTILGKYFDTLNPK